MQGVHFGSASRVGARAHGAQRRGRIEAPAARACSLRGGGSEGGSAGGKAAASLASACRNGFRPTGGSKAAAALARTRRSDSGAGTEIAAALARVCLLNTAVRRIGRGWTAAFARRRPERSDGAEIAAASPALLDAPTMLDAPARAAEANFECSSEDPNRSLAMLALAAPASAPAAPPIGRAIMSTRRRFWAASSDHLAKKLDSLVFAQR